MKVDQACDNLIFVVMRKLKDIYCQQFLAIWYQNLVTFKSLLNLRQCCLNNLINASSCQLYVCCIRSYMLQCVLF